MLKITKDNIVGGNNDSLCQSNVCMALYSALNTLTSIKNKPKQITLQRKMNTEKDVLYGLLSTSVSLCRVS